MNSDIGTSVCAFMSFNMRCVLNEMRCSFHFRCLGSAMPVLRRRFIATAPSDRRRSHSACTRTRARRQSSGTLGTSALGSADTFRLPLARYVSRECDPMLAQFRLHHEMIHQFV